MKALVKRFAKEGLWLCNVDIPEVGSDDIMVKIAHTGICGTDLHIWNWDEWAQQSVDVPTTIGHEFVGEVVEIGSNVERIRCGARVSGEGHIVCAHSRAARCGTPHHADDVEAIGITRDGAFAEYLALPAWNAIPIPDSIDNLTASILDPLGNAVHAALSFDLTGQDVLITGAGPIGIMSACIARHVGARRIVISDINAARLRLATSMVDVIPANVASESLSEVLKSQNIDANFTVGLEMSGATAAFDDLVAALSPGGMMALLGLPPKPAMVDWNSLIFKNLTIKTIYGREMFRTWYKMIALLESGLDVSPLVTRVLDAGDFAQAFDELQRGAAGKFVLSWPPELAGNTQPDLQSSAGLELS